jgi:AcrR family transcriptional regulator
MTFANRTEELALFEKMLRRQLATRILLIEAPSGYGKTGLMSRFASLCPAPNSVVPIDLKAAREGGIAHLFYRVQRVLGSDRFSRFNREISALGTGVEIRGNRLSGDQSQIQVILQTSPEERQMRLERLQQAFFNDLQGLKQPIVFILDTFNEAPEELANWVTGQFLMEVAESDRLLAIVAGQQVPQPSVVWQHCHQHRRLDRITDHSAWYAYAQGIGLPFDQKEIGMVVDSWDGVPARVVEMLDAVARRRQQA